MNSGHERKKERKRMGFEEVHLKKEKPEAESEDKENGEKEI